jgi:hypothetical protein
MELVTFPFGGNGTSSRTPEIESIFQELAQFAHDQRFISQEHVVVSVTQLGDLRVLESWAEALYCTRFPLRERLDEVVVFLLPGAVLGIDSYWYSSA